MRFVVHILAYFALCVLLSITLQAQKTVLLPAPSSPTLKFERLGLDDGLSQSSIFAITQDRYGFLWFCTQDGLNRYDGYTFRIFRNIPDDSLSLALNWVNDLYTAPSGRLWAITRSTLNLFNPTNETFTRFPLNAAQGASPQASVTVSGILESANGMLWVGTNIGLMRLSAIRHTTECFAVLNEGITALALDSAQRLWVGTAKGLFVGTLRDNNKIQFSPVTALGGAPVQAVSSLNLQGNTLWVASVGGLGKIMVSGKNSDGAIAAAEWFYPAKALPERLRTNNPIGEIKPDTRGNLWLRLATGLLLFSPQNAVTRVFMSNASEINARLSNNTVSALAEDRTGKMWIATADGLNIYNPLDNTLSVLKHRPSEPKSLGYNLLRCLLQDRNGTMWVGSDNGINSWNPNRYKFTAFQSNPMQTESLSNNSARSFLADNRTGEWQSGIWVGTDNGLNYLNRRTQEWKSFSTADGLLNTDIRAMAQTPDGTLWLGTNGGGLFRFDGKTFTQYAYNPDDSTSIASNRLRWLMVDSKGGLWAGLYLTPGARGTTGGVCYHPNPQRGVQTGWKRLQSNPALSTSLATNEIRFLYTDPDDTSGNTMWIGTHTAGLERFDRTKGVLAHFRHDTKNNASLSSDIVTCILRTQSKELWIATASGLNLFDPQTQKFTRFTVKNGLPNDFVYGLLEDAQGNLWMSSNNGLSRFNPRTRTFQNYDRSDGLPGNEGNSGAFLKLASGEMLFGGLDGFTLFHPDSIRIDTVPPTLALTWFNVLNKPRYFDKPLNELDEIRLAHDENFIAFEFAALEFVNTAQNQYAFMLDGLDKNWIFPKGRRYAAYTDLQPGEYVFRVKAANCDGVWNETGKAIRIVIVPPFWATWWFRMLLVLALGIALYAAHKGRLRVMAHRNKLLKKLIEERTAELEASNAELLASDEEIRRQNRILEEQTAQIELVNGELQLRNSDLEIVNEQLEDYSAELDRFSVMLEEQAREVELVNTELQEKNTSLQNLNQRKNEIIGVVAHDLKNPLAGILMSASMVSRYYQKMKPEDVLQSIQRIQETGERMHKIIVDLLDVEAIETGTFNLKSETVDLTALLNAMLEDYREAAAQKNITVHKPTNEALFVQGDVGALRQVFDNLFSNALKYSFPQSNVWVDVSADTAMVRVNIRDEGPGLSPGDQAKLFQRFAKLTPRPTAGEHSTGLGLSIVKQLVELMHGEISCQSELGVGTTFSVVLARQDGAEVVG